MSQFHTILIFRRQDSCAVSKVSSGVTLTNVSFNELHSIFINRSGLSLENNWFLVHCRTSDLL